MIPKTPIYREARQIVDKEGNPYRCYITEPLWVGQDKDYHAYAKLTEGNAITPFTTGRAYFEELIKTIGSASEEVLIAGWQVNWDALLAPGVRLFDVVLRAAKRGVKFYVMPWDDAPPVQTYDEQTASVFERINEMELDEKRVFTLLASSDADKAASFFSHHQKQVVVDRKVCFVGGIDLAYGRYDDAGYRLDMSPEPKLRVGLNRYNPCIAPAGKLPETEVCDPDLLTGIYDHLVNRTTIWNAIKNGACQVPYDEDGPADPRNPAASYTTVDETKQPRMPWQDIHTKIEGPAVSDLTLNFVMRWNAIVARRELRGSNEVEAMKGYHLALPEPPASYAKCGGCVVQVLRSAPKALREAEYKAVLSKDPKRFPKPDTAQTDVLHAMLILIEKARDFIYIENQFFQSDFGQESSSIPSFSQTTENTVDSARCA